MKTACGTNGVKQLSIIRAYFDKHSKQVKSVELFACPVNMRTVLAQSPPLSPSLSLILSLSPSFSLPLSLSLFVFPAVIGSLWIAYKSSYTASPVPVPIHPNLSSHPHSKNSRYSAYRHSPTSHIVNPCCFPPTLEAFCFYFSVCHRHNMSFTYSLPMSIFGQFPFFHSRNPAPQVGYTTILQHPNICLMLKILSNGNKDEEKVQTTHVFQHFNFQLSFCLAHLLNFIYLLMWHFCYTEHVSFIYIYIDYVYVFCFFKNHSII